MPRRTTLASLVDDYFEKHDAALAAGRAWEAARKTCTCRVHVEDQRLVVFQKAHAARAAAFRALRAARKSRRTP